MVAPHLSELLKFRGDPELTSGIPALNPVNVCWEDNEGFGGKENACRSRL